MDGSPGSDGLPEFDDSFVLGAAHRELSHRDRLLHPEEPYLPPRRPRRTRQVIGVVITVVVLVVAYGAQYLPIGNSSFRGLVPVIPNGCSSGSYPSDAQYRFEACFQGRPVTWPRCSTLRVVVDPTNAPFAWREDIPNALTQLSQATGLRFQTAPKGSGEITIAWTSKLLAPAGWERDKAGLTLFQSRVDAVGAEIASAGIQISSRLSGGGGPGGELPVLLHELGHAVGLGHFTGPEVMHPVDQGYGTYQGGDLAGLARLYGPASCGLR